PGPLRGRALACIPLPFLTFPVLFRRLSTEKTRNVFRLRLRSRLRAKEPGPTDPRGPRSASAKARPPRDPDFREFHVGPRVGPAGGGLRGRHRAAGILHAVGQSDGAGTRGRAGGP